MNATTTITVRARCPRCGRIVTATARRNWAQSDDLSCCGLRDTPYISVAGDRHEVMHAGIFIPIR